MNATGTITMSMTELDRLKVVQAVCERRLKPGQVADRLALSMRQVVRLVRRYQAAGVAELVSGKRGRPGNHQLADGVARHSLAIIRDRYADLGPTLVCEKLRECHGIGLAVETVRVLMMAAGRWIPRRDRPSKVYQPRNRRAYLGETRKRTTHHAPSSVAGAREGDCLEQGARTRATPHGGRRVRGRRRRAGIHSAQPDTAESRALDRWLVAFHASQAQHVASPDARATNRPGLHDLLSTLEAIAALVDPEAAQTVWGEVQLVSHALPRGGHAGFGRGQRARHPLLASEISAMNEERPVAASAAAGAAPAKSIRELRQIARAP